MCGIFGSFPSINPNLVYQDIKMLEHRGHNNNVMMITSNGPLVHVPRSIL